MRLREVVDERTVGVAFDRDRHILIHISRPTRRARMIGFGLIAGLVLILMLLGRHLGGGWEISSLLLSCTITYSFGHLSPVARTYYDSWQYPESYDMFDDETIRDRFFTHTEEFTHIEEK